MPILGMGKTGKWVVEFAPGSTYFLGLPHSKIPSVATEIGVGAHTDFKFTSLAILNVLLERQSDYIGQDASDTFRL